MARYWHIKMTKELRDRLENFRYSGKTQSEMIDLVIAAYLEQIGEPQENPPLTEKVKYEPSPVIRQQLELLPFGVKRAAFIRQALEKYVPE